MDQRNDNWNSNIYPDNIYWQGYIPDQHDVTGLLQYPPSFESGPNNQSYMPHGNTVAGFVHDPTHGQQPVVQTTQASTHHSYSRLSVQDLPPHNYNIALNNITPLTGDLNGAHQCMYMQGRSVCRRSFPYALDAMLHVAEEHLCNVRFRCSCGRTFTKLKYVLEHVLKAATA
ncbi:hypothetical protein M422DRAFT_239817 [Sphaerobolus stellatus SS14]|nr:hypothetical protein M422DRAFT_239817 [Sphaerobolus stellatus SS14]